MEHRVRVSKIYKTINTPWKWRACCDCGWTVVSWQWVAVDRPGGALPHAINHVRDMNMKEA